MQIGRFKIELAKKQKLAQQPVPNPPTTAIGTVGSLLYRATDFEHYNPDDLVTRQGYRIYKKMMKDSQVKAVYRFRRNSITGRRWCFEFPEEIKEQLSEDEIDLRTAVFEKSIKQVKGNFRRVMNKVLSSMTYGFSVNEKLFGTFEHEGKKYWGLKEVLKREPDSIFFEVDNAGSLVNMKQLQESQKVILDSSRFIHHVYNPEEDDYYGLSELREVYRDWWSKDVTIKLRNIFLERLAGGLVWVQPTPEAATLITPGTTAYSQLQNALSTITTDTGLILPGNVNLHVEMPKDARAFEEAIRSQDKAISKGALMPNLLGLAEQGDTGSYAQSQTQLEAFLWMLDTEASDLEETLNEQLFKDIGEYNFGDGLYPEFKFHQLSRTMIERIVKIWSELVSTGSVEASDTDEDFLRDMLDMPEKGTPISKPAPQQPAPQQPMPTDVQPTNADGPTTTEGEPIDGIAETIIGRSGTIINLPSKKNARKLFNIASRRVDFVAIDMSSNVAEEVYISELSSSMSDIINGFVDAIRTNDQLLTDPEEVTKLRIQSSSVSQLRKKSAAMLKDGWELGTTHSKRELTKAGKQVSNEFTAKFATLSDIAANYFKAKSFKMAGNLSQDALDAIQNILFNGIKFSKSQDEIIKEVYITFARKGMLDPADIKEAEDLLREALQYDNPTARLKTAVRTNYFEAVNEARFSFFTDNDLGGFVTALTYNAVLDSRVTEICRDLDDRTYPLNSELWDKYRPPNHFNCRSILVPVTQNDEIAITRDAPNVQPQEGFG